MKVGKFYNYITTFLFVIIFVGYPLVTTLLLPNISSFEDEDVVFSDLSRLVTVPYRFFVFIISLIIIIFHPKSKFHVSLRWYYLFWLLLLTRMFYDVFYRIDLHFSVSQAKEIFVYMFISCIVPIFAIIRGWASINFEKARKWLTICFILLIPLFFLNNPDMFSLTKLNSRMTGNLALNAISTGHCGVTLAILSFYSCQLYRRKSIWAYLFIIPFLIGCLITFQSGSRGPFVALLLCFLLYIVLPHRNLFLSFSFIIVCVLIVVTFGNYFSTYFPVMSDRFYLEDISNGRTGLYQIAISKFMEHPFCGSSFAIILDNGSLSYSHNVILDAFMGLGFLGGLLFILIYSSIIVKSLSLIRRNSKYNWIAVIALQYFVGGLLSGTFYKSELLNLCMVSILLIPNNKSFSHINNGALSDL